MERPDFSRFAAYGLAIAALLVLAGPYPSSAMASEWSKETRVKAEFVYRFASMTRWPESAFPANDESFRIGVIGDTEFVEALKAAVEGKRLDGRAIRVEKLAATSSKRRCQVVYIASDESGQLREVLDLSNAEPVLTVSDDSRFVDRGGMIQLDRDGSRLRFAINRSSAIDSNLVISSKLLRLATRVVDGDGT